MDIKFKILVLIALICYVFSAADLAPGPIDDLILIAAFILSNRSSGVKEAFPESSSTAKH